MSHSDMLRIMISTDNHLGVWEKDEVRKDDSFRAFDEMLATAADLGVDMVVLGGDLFHENKPSRSTMVKAMQIINKRCMGDKPVSFQILSDQAANFVGGTANYLDPDLNISLPIFTIHGNHDDPTGADNLSAVDVLSSCRLVNYFGKHSLGGSNIGKVTLSPILFQKGTTRLALYGLGSVRDERLARLFAQAGMVSWCRPQPTDQCGMDDWVNVMVLHQNRVERGAASKNSVQESHLPSFLDLVIWGHEHECKPEAEDLKNPDTLTAGKEAKVIQPGSSVVTSLSEGEAKRKHMFLLEAKDNQYRLVKYPFVTTRPFVFEQVMLRDQPSIKVEDPLTINVFLENKVLAMIAQVAQEQPQDPNVPPLLPLVRLRVDYTGFSTINTQRFGQKFVGKVANPQDLLIWSKSTKRAKGAGGGGAGGEVGGQADETDDLLRPDQLDQQKIEDLVAANLQTSLKLLHEDDLASALHDFVEKDDKAALHDLVTRSLMETARPILADETCMNEVGENDKALEDVVQASVIQRREARAAATAEGLDPIQAAEALLKRQGVDPSAAGPSNGGRSGFGFDGIEDDDEGAGGGVPSTLATNAAAGRGKAAAARGGGGKAGAKAVKATPSVSARGRGGGAPSASHQATPAMFQAFSAAHNATAGTTAAAATAALSDNMDFELNATATPGGVPLGGSVRKMGGLTQFATGTGTASKRPTASTLPTKPKRARTTKAPSSRKGKAQDEDDLDDDDEDEDEDFDEADSDGDDEIDNDDDEDFSGGRKGRTARTSKSQIARVRGKAAPTPMTSQPAKGRPILAAATQDDPIVMDDDDDDPKVTTTQQGAGTQTKKKLPSSFSQLAASTQGKNSQQSKGGSKKQWGSVGR